MKYYILHISEIKHPILYAKDPEKGEYGMIIMNEVLPAKLSDKGIDHVVRCFFKQDNPLKKIKEVYKNNVHHVYLRMLEW